MKLIKVLLLTFYLLALVPQPALAQESAAAGLIRRSNAAIPNLYAGKTTATPGTAIFDNLRIERNEGGKAR